MTAFRFTVPRGRHGREALVVQVLREIRPEIVVHREVHIVLVWLCRAVGAGRGKGTHKEGTKESMKGRQSISQVGSWGTTVNE